MNAFPAAGGGRWVVIDPERLDGWLTRFSDRHGAVACVVGETAVVFTAADGAVAECRVPFPPLRIDPGALYGGLTIHAVTDRRVGVLLVRLGGYAAGVFHGTRLITSKVGSRQVHGRSAAGGWSQQRFARRRQGQIRDALSAAADVAAATLVPAVADLDAVVIGGDRRAVDTVLEDPRLAVLRPLLVEPLLDTPDPRLRVLQQVPRQFRATRVRIVEPTGPTTGPHRGK
ncbi:acVLRF1 family peptidyl-tRNA hydrolase [Frankia sp. Cppng1_Ct_nod]|uniref:acVLRF1 family peptidyl-tRNA hydrolase n=1 Tax=Frankia sp. Cppng1_Ct_nod TaxID=2897162 RepID=UPI0020252543|nr:acVLRF1 family peptidyl-tRNA hydrolase [Frankia sp. Cppng1_Ct_nod]